MSDAIPRPSGGDVDIGGMMMRTIWSLYGITIVIVGMRLYAQLKTSGRLGLGDALMALSVACGIALCSMLTVQHHYGLGRHFFFLSTHQRIMAGKFNFVGQAFGIMAPTFGRMSFIVLLVQLFGTTKWKRWGLWALFWQSLLVNGLTLILVYAQCPDVQSLWDPVGHPSTCWSPLVQEDFGFFQGSMNAATDLFLTILPATILWSVQIDLKLKLGLAFLLGLSVFALVGVIIKTVLLKSLGDRGDITFNTVPFFTWVVVECTLVSIAASVPLIRPLFMKTKNRDNTNARMTYEMKNRYASNGKASRLRSIDPEVGPDNSSEENILPVEGVKVDGKRNDIVLETSYNVRYDQKDTVSTKDVGAKSNVWTGSRKSQPNTPWPSPGVAR